MNPSPLKTWLMAIRPKTLPAAFAPVFMGTAMAYGDGIHHFPTAFLCLLAALLVQIGTNLANDYFDFKKGADTQERLGPVRVTQAGLIAPNAVLIAAGVTFLLALLVAKPLIERGGTPILIIAIASVLSGILYTAGPKPLGYIGLGDLFVFIFFGLIATAATYYVQSFELNPAVILAGIGPGLISAAILTVNNLRDIESDRKSGKRTLAVRFGRDFARGEYIAYVLIASLVPVFIYLLIYDHPFILLACFSSLLAIPGIMDVLSKEDGPSLNEALAFTGRLLLAYSILFSIGWIL